MCDIKPPKPNTVHRDCLFCSPLWPHPSTISVNHCSWHATFLGLNGEWGCKALVMKSELSCWTKVGNYVLFPCHSVYLEFALHTLWVYALFIYSLKSHEWQRKERSTFILCCSLTWEELWKWQNAEIIFIHSDIIFHYHSIRSLSLL